MMELILLINLVALFVMAGVNISLVVLLRRSQRQTDAAITVMHRFEDAAKSWERNYRELEAIHKDYRGANV